MKILNVILLLFSMSAFADFSESHSGLCQTSEVKTLMGNTGNCQLALASVDVNQVSSHCEGKISDITCRVMMLKTSDSASMNLSCGDENAPILTQILAAEVLSYNVSAIVRTPKEEFVVVDDPNEYHLFSHPALDVQLSLGNMTKAKMVLTLQDRMITLTNVKCQ